MRIVVSFGQCIFIIIIINITFTHIGGFHRWWKGRALFLFTDERNEETESRVKIRSGYTNPHTPKQSIDSHQNFM